MKQKQKTNYIFLNTATAYKQYFEGKIMLNQIIVLIKKCIPEKMKNGLTFQHSPESTYMSRR